MRPRCWPRWPRWSGVGCHVTLVLSHRAGRPLRVPIQGKMGHVAARARACLPRLIARRRPHHVHAVGVPTAHHLRRVPITAGDAVLRRQAVSPGQVPLHRGSIVLPGHFQVIERADRCEHLGRSGALPSPRLEPALLLRPVQQAVQQHALPARAPLVRVLH